MSLTRSGRGSLRPGTTASLGTLAVVLFVLLAGCASPAAPGPVAASSAPAKPRDINLVYTGYGQGIVDTTPPCT